MTRRSRQLRTLHQLNVETDRRIIRMGDAAAEQAGRIHARELALPHWLRFYAETDGRATQAEQFAPLGRRDRGLALVAAQVGLVTGEGRVA